MYISKNFNPREFHYLYFLQIQKKYFLFIDSKVVQKGPKNKSENFMPELENILLLCIHENV